MPAMLDDPTAAIVYRSSGDPPYPTPDAPSPPEIMPRQVILRDRVTTATLIPFNSPDQVPPKLLAYLNAQLNREIEKGDTYPMTEPLPLPTFGLYWFGTFGAVMLMGSVANSEEARLMEEQGADWDKQCLGSFFIKPNYPGRSSHVCNASFLVTDLSRNRGVGRLMGECYLEWAPKLGYTYSVFNLVYETNVASLRIWDALGFKRIGRVKGCGNLRSYPEQFVDAIIYGRDLSLENEDFVSEERFDKIRFYLKHGKYPNGADRAEKSRLRSAATHYKLLPAIDQEPERLMLKGKEVIAEPQRQYEIARKIHTEHHGGINKTTATIAECYHWVRIKETVSMVIRNCPECKELAKAPVVTASREQNNTAPTQMFGAAGRLLSLPGQAGFQNQQTPAAASFAPQGLPPQLPSDGTDSQPGNAQDQVARAPMAPMGGFVDYEVPVDPRMMEGIEPYAYPNAGTQQQLPTTSQYNQDQYQSQTVLMPQTTQTSRRTRRSIVENAEQSGLTEDPKTVPEMETTGGADRDNVDIGQQLMDAGYGAG